MSRYNVECSTCGIHIGYVYHSGPIGWTNCAQCGDAEQEREEQEDDGERCSECGQPGCQGHCAGDDMMGDSA